MCAIMQKLRMLCWRKDGFRYLSDHSGDNSRKQNPCNRKQKHPIIPYGYFFTEQHIEQEKIEYATRGKCYCQTKDGIFRKQYRNQDNMYHFAYQSNVERSFSVLQ